MRLWSLHPKYLDAQGLVALWRESLLAQKVLQGATKGYQHHPQLARFRSHPRPAAAIATYLRAVHAESLRRGYSFDAAKIDGQRTTRRIACTRGQFLYEWKHLKKKLRRRDPARYHDLLHRAVPDLHPLFTPVPGRREPWEVVNKA
jgi:hypothetical protein